MEIKSILPIPSKPIQNYIDAMFCT